jgi:hypothetical protein
MNKYDPNKKKKVFKDEWGHDPSVQSMRRVFSYMEEAQQELLKNLSISLFDTKLRHCREQALELFERAWPLAVRQGMTINEKETATLYIHCLAQALSLVGFEVPNELLPRDKKVILFLQKALL